MAQWIPDPQGRAEVEKVSKNLKLPVWQAWYKGKFRDFWNEVWGKIDDSYGLLKTLADGKVSKNGDTMTGQLEIKINPQHTADFLYLYRNNDKIASLGGGVDDFFIHNSVANTTLQMKNNGYAFYPALNLKTISKEVVGAINELNSKKFDKTGGVLTGDIKIENNAHSLFDVKGNGLDGGFGHNNGDYIYIVNRISGKSIDLYNDGRASYPALNLQTVSKEVVGAINEVLTKTNAVQNIANSKEPKFSKNSGFNKNKSDSVSLDSTDTLATSKAVKVAYDKGVEALVKANTKENAIVKKSGFNLDKSDSITLNDTNKLATSRAVNLLNTQKFDKTGGVLTGRVTIENEGSALFNVKNSGLDGGFGHNNGSYIYIVNRISGKSIDLYNDGRASYPALNLRTTAKEVVQAINEVDLKKIDKSELEKTLINFNQIISSNAILNLTQPLSTSMNFVNIKFAEPDGQGVQYIKIPMKLLEYNIKYMIRGVGADEVGTIAFINNQRFDYKSINIEGVNQCTLHKIWQSMI